MGSPTIFSGTFCKLLNSAGILRKNGHILNYDGPKNYIANNHAEVNVSGWSTYADAAGTSPVDMTGGSPNVTWTRTTTTPLSGSGSFLLTKDAANRQGEGVAYAITTDNADKNKQIRVAFDFEASANFVSGDSSDIRVYVYDVTNSASISLNKYTIAQGTGKFEAFFDATSGTSYRVGLHVATTNASAWTFKADNFFFGVTAPVFGAAMSNLVNESSLFTTSGLGTIANTAIFTKRIGDELYCRGFFNVGTPDGTTASINLPSKYVIDTTKISTATNVGFVGQGIKMGNSLNSILYDAAHSLFFDGSDTGKLFIAQSSQTYTFTKQAGNSIFSASGAFPFEFRIPIVGWSSNVTLSNSSTFYVSPLVANGTRVTAAPTQLGEYRTLIKAAGARTSSDNAPSQTAASITSNGMLIYSVPVGTAGTSGQPNKWEIFVGKNKNVFIEWYSSTGRTGYLSVDQHMDNTDANWYGVNQAYDPTTGILIVNAIPNHTTTNAAVGIGVTEGTGDITGPSSAYFDVKVAENALAVGNENPRSEIWLYGGNGFGSTNTRIRRYTTVGKNVGQAMTLTQSSTNGDSITINEDGIYSILAVDTRTGAGSTQFGISKNSAQLTTGIASITITDVLAINQCNSGDRSKNATVTTILSRGDVIRGHGDAAADATANVEVMFRITKISQ